MPKRRDALKTLAAASVAPSLVLPASAKGTGTIKVGALYSLTGTMAISTKVLTETVLMGVDEINRFHGGVLGRRLEAVVADPASTWPLFSEKAKQMITRDGVAAIFGCWTSMARKAVLPVVEQHNNLLFYALQYEGEELSNNVFYTGATPNQQAIPAVQYLMSPAGGGARRFVLLGTDYLYPRTTNQILRAFLKSKGVKDAELLEIYTPFGHRDYQAIVAKIKQFSQGGKTAVVSTINGDSNLPFYQALAHAGVRAKDVPVMAFSIGEVELRSMDTAVLHGHLAAWNYFMSVQSQGNAVFTRNWANYAKAKRIAGHATRPVTSDPMEAVWIGMHMWRQAVEKAKTTETNAVIAAMAGQRYDAPSGFTVHMDEKNHHLHKPVMVGEIKRNGQFDVVWQSPGLVKAQPWSPYIAGNDKNRDEPVRKSN